MFGLFLIKTFITFITLTLLQWGIPTGHKASLLTRNDLSLASQLLIALTPTQNLSHMHKSWTGREEETLRTQQNTCKLNSTLQIRLSYTWKTFKTVTCFKLYQVYIKQVNFKKKTVNTGSGKVQPKPSIFTAPSFTEPVKTSILKNALGALKGRRKIFFWLKLSSPKSTMLTTQTS